MKTIGQTVIFAIGLMVLSACASSGVTGPSPADLNADISDLRGQTVTEANAPEMIDQLNSILSGAETQMTANTSSPALTLAWTFTAMNAADALTALPGQSSEAVGEAAGKTLNYADRVSTSCLNMGASGIDSRQGNFCGMALAIRRLNDTSQAIQAFSSATEADDWAGSAAASNGFNTQVATNWTAYADDANGLALSDQNKTPFARMALQKTCELQSAQSAANLLGNPSIEDDVIGAQDAYWGAMAEAADFLEIRASASACESEPEGIACQRETEIKVAEICQAL